MPEGALKRGDDYRPVMRAELTLGAEEELHLIDLGSWELSARAPQLLSRLPSSSYVAEIQRTTVETNTAVVTSLSDLRDELLRLRAQLVDVAGKEGLGVAAVGTAPRSTFADFELTTTGRYSRIGRRGVPVRRLVVGRRRRRRRFGDPGRRVLSSATTGAGHEVLLFDRARGMEIARGLGCPQARL